MIVIWAISGTVGFRHCHLPITVYLQWLMLTKQILVPSLLKKRNALGIDAFYWYYRADEQQ